MAIDATPKPWWKDAIVYQIYPASFFDANGDGIGDIPGITQKLDYIQSLGVDTVWVCPMYDSPQVDMGYDVRDYTAVYEPYGSVQDVETLVADAHGRGMKVLLDLVINHTSDQHRWFKESRASKTNAKRDWYIWRPAQYDADGKRHPPNNWRAVFEGSAWQWDDETQEYYLHLFCPEQPDLNWENAEMRKALYEDSMIFWLEKGVDGFRIDTVNMYSKPPGMPDAPIVDPESHFQPAGDVYCNGPRMREYLSEMNAIFTRYGAMTVGECPHTADINRVIEYVSASTKQMDMVFQFDVVDVGKGKAHGYATTPKAYTLPQFKNAVRDTQTFINGTDAWTTSFIENHDQARTVSRHGDDSPQWRVRSAKMLALLFGSLSGTLFVYQGQELGCINLPLDIDIKEYKDVDTGNYYHEVQERYGNDPKKNAWAKAALQHLARDHARTPMPWSAEKHAGFTTGEPWMISNPSAQEGINVMEEDKDSSSVLNFWRQLLKLRRSHADVMVHGFFDLLDAENPTTFSFLKRSEESGRKLFVACNFSGEQSRLRIPKELESAKLDLVMSNVDRKAGEESRDTLEPWEARAYLL